MGRNILFSYTNKRRNVINYFEGIRKVAIKFFDPEVSKMLTNSKGMTMRLLRPMEQDFDGATTVQGNIMVLQLLWGNFICDTMKGKKHLSKKHN